MLSAQAAAAAREGRYDAADRMLADFALQYARTGEAADARYWRALYRADPDNETASARDATAVVDSALALPLDSAQRSNFLALRRIAVAMELAGAPEPAARSNGGQSSTKPDDRPPSDEVQQLKSELAKANAELERIKKRVAQPKP